MRNVLCAAVAVVAVCVVFECQAQDKPAEKKAQKFQIMLNPEKIKGDTPEVEGRFTVKNESVTTEHIPAVYKNGPDGKSVMVAPERVINHPVPAVYETRAVKLVLDEEMAKKLKELAAKRARVEISGTGALTAFKVTAIDEK